MFRTIVLFLLSLPVLAAGLPDTVARIKPSIVGVATHLPTRAPRAKFFGTGFVVGDGLTVVTNLHVPPKTVDQERLEELGVLVNPGPKPEFRRARRVAEDPGHDLALLRIDGPPLPALRIGDSGRVREGDELYIIGYPLGAVLGLYTTVHRAGVAAIPPVYSPRQSAGEVDLRLIRKLGEPYPVFQLDGAAFPGNSGSPLFDPATGEVLGVINQVLLKSAKEGPNFPSGITYAIPASHVRELLESSAKDGAGTGSGNGNVPAKPVAN